MERYERLERIVHKSEHDVVTEVDGLSEELILDAIRRVYPDDRFLAEESGTSGGRSEPSRGRRPGTGPGPRPGSRSTAGADTLTSPDQATPDLRKGRVWVIDPLDGTVNYANGIPIFCVSIGLAIDGRPAAGALYDPVRGEMFTAVAGRGACLDGLPVRHPAKEKLSDCVVSVSLPRAGYTHRGRALGKAIRVSRSLGSASLSLACVANGRFDAFIQLGGLSAWDVAAAGLIAEEAGVRVTDGTGGAWFDLGRRQGRWAIVAAAPAQHAAIAELLA